MNESNTILSIRDDTVRFGKDFDVTLYLAYIRVLFYNVKNKLKF